MMYAMSIITILVLVLLFFAHFFLASLFYFLGGFLWLLFQQRLSPFLQAWGYFKPGGRFFLFLIWPLSFFYMFQRSWKIMFSDARYEVVGEGEHKTFGKWGEAIEFAKKQATEQKDVVMIMDNSKIIKQRNSRNYQEKSWLVWPEGKVKRL